MKVCIYAICKNEERFVKRWLASAEEADEIYINDTGSTDKTIELLKNNPKVHLIQNQNPKEVFRFDKAWNKILSYIPQNMDLLVRLDLDQSFTAGWRAILEEEVNEFSEKEKEKFSLIFRIYSFEERVFNKKENLLRLLPFNCAVINNKALRYVGAVHEEIVCTEKPRKFIDIPIKKIAIVHTPFNVSLRDDKYLNLAIINFQEVPTYRNFLILTMSIYNQHTTFSFDKNALMEKFLKIALSHTEKEDYEMEVLQRGISFKSEFKFKEQEYSFLFFLFYYFYLFYMKKDFAKAEILKKEKLSNDITKNFQNLFLKNYFCAALKGFFRFNEIPKETIDSDGNEEFRKLIF